MAAFQNGLTNGHANDIDAERYTRFSDVPAVIDIPVRGEDGDEAVNLDLTELQDDTDELCDLLANENAAKNYWITIALAYVKDKKVDVAIDMIKRGLQAFERGKTEDRLGLLTCLVWLQLWRSRHTRRTKPDSEVEDQRNKDSFLQDATATLNDAMRLSPSYPPLSLARGVLGLLKAALLTGQPAGRSGGDRSKQLTDAVKAFDETLRHSHGKNIMALLGKARATYIMGKYAEAFQMYQQALERAPDMTDPDPRIGLGCCLWALGHKEHAQAAWDRSLELNPNSSIAHTLLGLYYLDQSSQYATSEEAFGPLYKKAMTIHTQTAFKLNDMQPLTCSTFGGYFLLRKNWANVDKLAKRAVEQTDTTAIMSDGWYLRARQAHYQDDIASAAESYNKSDLARGGDEKGYLPAKFGAAQLRIANQDLDGAKFRLEKIVAQSRNPEAMTLLGVLHAEEVFAAQAAGSKEDKSSDRKKAVGLLESVRAAWRDPKKKMAPDAAVLLNLARLYETDAHDKSLACLLQVEQMELDRLSEEESPEGIDDETELKKALREGVSPQLLNNIGCFHFYGEKYAQAREDFQTALNACVKQGNKDEADPVDTDALVTTISFNLARTYEAENMDEEAKNVYASLLQRHPDYTEANLRLTYIALNTDPAAAATSMKQLIESDPSNLEIRSLYGWYINKTKKRTLALNEDAEQRHYKQTLQTYDKHDLYSLTGMGNLHLAVAREMPRSTDQEKDKRSGVYRRAVEFFDKVLALDPRNAYAAQGMGIALVEDRKDVQNSIQIFSKARESMKDYSVHLNLGHVFVDVKQFGRSIENYEIALGRMKATDPQLPTLLACLGRVWLLRGRAEVPEARLEAMKTSLAYSRRALEAAKGAKDEINHRFNVAFVQIQIAQLVNGLKESQRSLADVETASRDLDEAIAAFGEIAKAPNPPFPAGDIEQRASMGRNTMKRQLTEAINKQTEHESKNASKLEEARRARELAVQQREEAKRKAAEEEEARRAKIAEERQRMMEEDRQLIQQRLEDEKAREEAEFTDDPETGERKKREKKPKAKGSGKRKKKGGEDSDDDIVDGSDEDGEGGEKPKKSKKKKGRSARSSVTPAGSDDEAAPKKKKRRLARKDASAKSNKYKSADFIQDSSEDEDGDAGTQKSRAQSETPAAETPDADADELMSDVGGGGEDEEESVARPAQRKKAARVLDEDEDEDEDEGEGEGEKAPAAGDENHG